MARLKNSIAHWALEVGQWAQAREYFGEALREFTALEMTSEVQRALWGVAELDAREGSVDHAVTLLRDIYHQFLNRGMYADAALVYLDISMKLDAKAPEHDLAKVTCIHFARTMTAANAPRAAVEAAQYLGERGSGSIGRDSAQRNQPGVRLLSAF